MDAMPLVESLDERSTDTTPIDVDAISVLMARVLAHEGIPTGAEASLTLVDPDRIAELKSKYLDGDRTPTDVLSFPIDGAEGDPFDSNPSQWMVGDVVLCPSVAADQAPLHTGCIEDEIALLVVHGSLHLLGWDHADASQRRDMWERERLLMERFHRLPAKDPWSEPASQHEGDQA